MGWDYGDLSETSGPKFGGSSQIKVGNGGKPSFQNDVWAGQLTLKHLFLDIYNLNQQKLTTDLEVRDIQCWNLALRKLLKVGSRQINRILQHLEQAKNFSTQGQVYSG